MASRITVATLRMLLSERGLSTAGFNAALVERCCASGVALRALSNLPAPGGAVAAAVAPASQGCALPLSAPADDGPALAASSAAPVDAPAATAATAVTGQDASPAGADAGDRLMTPTAALPLVAPTPSARGGLSAVGPTSGRGGAATPRAPSFTKHEMARLAHVLCTPEVAAGVVTSRGVMYRQQQDVRTSPGSVWEVVVAPMFNSSWTFDVQAGCTDGGIDPNTHPRIRTGEALKSRWSDVHHYFSFLLVAQCICRGPR